MRRELGQTLDIHPQPASLSASSFVGEERDRGHTVFLSSHELDEVQRACDRVAIIRDGRLVAVESVDDATGRSYRHVTLEFSDAVDPQEFSRIPGVSDLVAEGPRLTFKVFGDVDPVIKAAARHTVTELELSRPTLEAIFLTYYGGTAPDGRTLQEAPASAELAARPPSRWRSLGAIVCRGLRDNRRAWLSWGGSLGALSSLMAAIWPSIEGAIDDALENYPQELKDAFNIREITTVEAYIDAEMMSLIVPLAVSHLAIRIVTRAISSAEEQRYLDTLLAAPVARNMLVAGTLVVAAIVVATVLAVMTLMTWITSLVAGADASLEVLARGAANVWPLSMLFAGLATLAAGVLHRSSQVTGVATGTLVAMYVIDLVGKLAEPVEPLRYVSAFKYYGSAIQDGIDPRAFAALTLTGIVLAVAGTLLFERRDVLAWRRALRTASRSGLRLPPADRRSRPRAP